MSSNDDQEPTTRVRRRSRPRALEIEAPAPSPPDPFAPGPMVVTPAPSTNLAQRLRDLHHADRNSIPEFIVQHMLPMIHQQRPIDEIARAFGIGIRQARKWRAFVYTRLGETLKAKTPSSVLAEQIAHHERTRAYAWQQAAMIPNHGINRDVTVIGNNGQPLTQILSANEVGVLGATKQRWIVLALKAEQELSILYAKVGLYTDTTLAKSDDDLSEDTTGGAALITNIAKEFLTGGYNGAKAATPVAQDRDALPRFEDWDN